MPLQERQNVSDDGGREGRESCLVEIEQEFACVYVCVRERERESEKAAPAPSCGAERDETLQG